MSIEKESKRFVEDPVTYFGGLGKRAHHMPAELLSELQLAGLKLRFGDLRNKVAVLKTIADEQGISEINSIDDAVPLLFQHTVYKSFPPSLLENGRFDLMTKWLGRLTTTELGHVDLDGCDSIDNWLDRMDAQTDLCICHSSGTSGTMSFFPRSLAENNLHFRSLRMGVNYFTDPEGGRDHSEEYFQCIWPTFRSGRSLHLRVPDFLVKYFAGSEDRLHALHPGRLSSDVSFFAARLRAAEARGEIQKLKLDPKLEARKTEFEQMHRSLQDALPRFLDEIPRKLRGERVHFSGTWNLLYDMSVNGLNAGIRGIFASDSVVMTGGGAKGQVIPADWEKRVMEFTGVPRLCRGYGLSEVMAGHMLCEHDQYHIEPWVILFVLDPDDGSILPRSGIQTGRAAFFDLMANSYWGGTITGDEVTIDHTKCPCGQTTPHIARAIERYSEKRGGDDKISCAASDDAHQAALDFLVERLN
jgi:hypothetical protein